MGTYTIKRGLDLPITGGPDQSQIETGPAVHRVALLAADYVGMKPRMHVAEGDSVRLGQLMFEDRKIEGVRFTAPGSGKVIAIHRGARRALHSVVIELGAGEPVAFESALAAKTMQRDAIKALLLESGLWTALRERPFSRVANPATTPDAIFVTAMDTNPLAPSVDAVLRGKETSFYRGLEAVTRLTDGKTYLCRGAGADVSGGTSDVEIAEFSGKHPAGTVGVHIHTLHPVGRGRTVWHLGYQDVVAIGRLVESGRLDAERVISLAGPRVARPRLLTTRLGASTDSITSGQLEGIGENRVISGSVLGGRTAVGDVHGYLGRYHNQVSVIEENRKRELIGWLMPGFKVFSTIPAFASAMLPWKKFDFTTTTNGSPRAMVPIGMYERVMPLDIMPTHLLRALVVGDVEWAEELGCLELDEEDLALCTFVCPGKVEYGPKLRTVLDQILKEG